MRSGIGGYDQTTQFTTIARSFVETLEPHFHNGPTTKPTKPSTPPSPRAGRGNRETKSRHIQHHRNSVYARLFVDRIDYDQLRAENAELRRVITDVAIPALDGLDEFSDVVAQLQEAVK